MVFSDKYNSIRIDTARRADRADRGDRAGRADRDRLAATGFTPGTVTTVQRRPVRAVLITYQADSAPNSVTGKVASQDVATLRILEQRRRGDADAVRAGRVGQRRPVAHRHRLLPVGGMSGPPGAPPSRRPRP